VKTGRVVQKLVGADNRVPGASHTALARVRQPGQGRYAAIPVALGLGKYQSERGLRLASKSESRRRTISSAAKPQAGVNWLSARFFPNPVCSPISGTSLPQASAVALLRVSLRSGVILIRFGCVARLCTMDRLAFGATPRSGRHLLLVVHRDRIRRMWWRWIFCGGWLWSIGCRLCGEKLWRRDWLA
jgi:hypothetical protein